MVEEPLMDTEEVARYLKVHVKTVMNLVERGDLRASKIGRHWRFRKSDVDEYFESRLNKPRTENKPSSASSEEAQK
jgi:excisionase family DNA binding protein